MRTNLKRSRGGMHSSTSVTTNAWRASRWGNPACSPPCGGRVGVVRGGEGGGWAGPGGGCFMQCECASPCKVGNACSACTMQAPPHWIEILVLCHAGCRLNCTVDPAASLLTCEVSWAVRSSSSSAVATSRPAAHSFCGRDSGRRGRGWEQHSAEMLTGLGGTLPCSASPQRHHNAGSSSLAAAPTPTLHSPPPPPDHPPSQP